MSPSVKLGLLTLVSTAAAVPHYGHSRFHKPSGAYGTGTGSPFPTGGYGNYTVLPSGTGAASEKTTTLLETEFSTKTIYSTIYATRTSGGAEASYVAPEEVETSNSECGPATVYVTATNKVTVTVTGGYPSGSASAAPSSAYTSFAAVIPPPVPTSEAAAVSSAEASSSSSSSSALGGGYEVPSISLPNKPVETPAETPVENPISVTEKAAPTSSAAAPSSSAASSTPTASPAPSSPSYSGGKRGLAYNEASLCSAFDASKFGFAYNWGATQYGSPLPEGIMFAPMMHKPSDMSAEEWLGHADDAIAAGSTLVMGFNEPDHDQQANLTPQQACDAWATYMNPVKEKHGDVTILGPSVTNGGAPMGLTWLQDFTDICGSSAKIDATNLHFYDVYENGAGTERFKAHVDQAIKQFGKKVFVTEYGLRSGTDAEASAFLKETMEYLEGNDMVSGYAYFMVGNGAMMLNSGNSLSSIGQVYNS